MHICHPDSFRFSSSATSWGCQHEKRALDEYKLVNESCHVGLTVSSAGLFISTQRPYIGASPDGLVNCKCCGWGICEIKV